MPKISGKLFERVSELVLETLFANYPQPLFTSQTAFQIGRDEEFTKKVLEFLEEKKLVERISKTREGKEYALRTKWRLAPQVYAHYSKKIS